MSLSFEQSPHIVHFTKGFIYWESIQSVMSEDDNLLTLTQDAAQIELSKGSMSSWLRLRGKTKKMKRKTKFATPTSHQGFCLSSMPELSGIIHDTTSWEQRFSSLRQQLPQRPSPLDWFQVVEFYSTTTFTYPQDRLIAISGLAWRIYRHIGTPYYCGLWADRFFHQLLWARGVPKLDWPAEPRAPSWSWASVDGEVMYPKGINAASVDSNTAFLGSTTELPAQDACLGHAAPWARDSGWPQLRVTMSKISTGSFMVFGDEELGLGPYRKSRLSSFNLMRFHRNTQAMRLRHEMRTVGLIIWDDSSLNEDKSSDELKGMFAALYCAKIAQVETKSGTIHFILYLAPVDGAQTVFRRVGIGQASPALVSSLSLWKSRSITLI